MHFSNTPHGIPGNEDYGAMASWISFAALGIFPRAGTTQFMIGSPRVERANLQLRHFSSSSSSGSLQRTSLLQIITYNNGPENVFVEKLLVNGVEHNSPFIEREVLASLEGAKLEFFMHSAPSSGLCSAQQ